MPLTLRRGVRQRDVLDRDAIPLSLPGFVVTIFAALSMWAALPKVIDGWNEIVLAVTPIAD